MLTMKFNYETLLDLQNYFIITNNVNHHPSFYRIPTFNELQTPWQKKNEGKGQKEQLRQGPLNIPGAASIKEVRESAHQC